MTTTNSVDSRTRFFRISVVVMLIVIIILLLLNIGCGRKLASAKADLANLSIDVSEIKETLKEQDSLFAILVAQNEEIVSEIDTLANEVSKLTEQVAKSKKREAIMINEISFMKNEIRNLAKKVDSLKNGFDVKLDSILNYVEENNSCDSVNFSDSKIITKKLSFTLTKKVFNKKHTKVVKESEIINYPSNLFYVNDRGFLENSYSKLYRYMNENSDSVKISFTSLAEGNYLTLSVNNSNESLLSKEAEFALGAGGLLTQDNNVLPWHEKIVHMEKTIDYDLKRRATWEILGGVFVGGLGGAGLWYFNKYPEATFTVNDSGGNPIFYTEIQNDFGKGVSAALMGAGGALFTKGIVDKILSVKVNPTEIGIVYTIK